MTTMTYPYKSILREEWTAEGREEGREAVRQCHDLAELERLLARAVTITDANDLFLE